MTTLTHHRTIIGDPQSAKGRANRRTFVGASEVAAVLGESPYAGPYRVYYDKVVGPDDDAPTFEMQLGHAVEPAICDYATRDGLVPFPITRNLPTVLHPQHRCIGANLDGAHVVDGRIVAIVECKFWEWRDREQLEILAHEPESLPPGKVWSAYLQMQAQMACAEVGECTLLALIEKQITPVTVPRSDAYTRTIIAECVGFWRAHVETQTPPTPNGRDLETVKRAVYHDPRITRDRPDLAPILAQYLRESNASRLADERKDDCAARIRAALDGASILTAPGYRATVSKTGRLTVKES
jgi:putative phage-type endonuclease